MLYNLHLLRVVAALGVVYFHATSEAGLKLDWDVGSRGVDVFFVISGFIIAYIGTRKPEQFLLRRLIRVVPFYWAATLALFAVVSVAPHVFRTTQADMTHVVYSLLFIPRETSEGMFPTLMLGWSLNFEMFFYVLFALQLRVSQKLSPLLTCAWIVAFVIAINAIASTNPILNFYARPIILEFCFGVGVFYAFEWLGARREALAKVAAVKWLLLVILVGNLVALTVLEQYCRDTISRALIAGIPAFFIVLSALLLERVYGVTTKSKLLYLLGESSYIIYLVHPYIIFAALRLLKLDASLPAPVLAVLILGLLAVTCVISAAVHVWFEKPLMAALRAKLT